MQKTAAEIKTDIQSNFPDNSNGEITEEIIRTTLTDIADSFIEKDGEKVLTDENFSLEEKNKLENIAEGATANRSDSATDTAISAAISALINGAPGALNALNELAAAMGNDANFAATVASELANKETKRTQSALAYNAVITLDFNHADAVFLLALTGNVAFANTSNKAAAREKTVIITADSSTRTLSFPAWTWQGDTPPAALAANKTAVLYLYCSGATESSILARYSNEL